METRRQKRMKLDYGTIIEPSRSTPKKVKMTKEQKEAMSTALLNPLIQYKIVNCLDFPELKTCRRVNKTWQKITSDVLLKRDCCVVRFAYDDEQKLFCTLDDRDDKMSNFVNLLKNKSSNFPCSDFDFRDGNLGHQDVQNFFKVHGHRIKSLGLFEPEKTSKSVIRRILVQFVPNLEILQLSGFDQLKWNKDDDDDPILLPSLRVFCWSDSFEIAWKILQNIPPNFQCIPYIDLDKEDLRVLKNSGLMSLVNRFRSVHDGPKFLTELARMEPKFQLMDFSNYDRSSVIMDDSGRTALENILECSKDTLDYLILSKVVSRVKIKIPTLSHLKTLHLIDSFSSPLFPLGIDLLEKFPSLRVLDFSGIETDQNEHWEDIFPSPDSYTGNFPTVKVLKIDTTCTEQWMSRLFSLCPNFTEAVIKSHRFSNSETGILSKVCKLWTHLESIVMTAHDCSAFYEYWMDSELTGLPSSTCERLWISMRHPEELKDASDDDDQIENHNSIRSLRDLKIFIVQLRREPAMPFSCVSCVHSFKLMPNLKVVIQFNHENIFVTESVLKAFQDELAPYVNIRHVKNI